LFFHHLQFTTKRGDVPLGSAPFSLFFSPYLPWFLQQPLENPMLGRRGDSKHRFGVKPNAVFIFVPRSRRETPEQGIPKGNALWREIRRAAPSGVPPFPV
jgi:hypothetical protein